MPDLPQSFAKLSEQWRKSRAHTYASENAEVYRGYDAGMQVAARELDALIEQWAAEIRAAQQANKSLPSIGPLYSAGIASAQGVILRDILGAKEKNDGR